ncbi:MAG: bifunctional glutamate N-acetyltransferase/amino-acid acetyltransferase ArgJ [Betaproteobacteria bacterium AqS2]|uniref:Arginine biosynthesis bifunctional protein ArgJ n=1 Tax=Candidatus Amphirhobacter heronislandensis TaxID=1732024 RepID=A0A930XWY4_9GAMM|nr:bifunctional glutamate N-acetyltransferase/amino-acid acetyltransferase ArgJ [Betaproteobacteria bacterium AqS2]
MPRRALHAVAGASVAGAAAGIKSDGAPDVALIVFEKPTPTAAVFTRNRFRAAPVEVCLEHLPAGRGHIRALLVNSGNANCGNGAAGLRVARESCAHAARLLGCAPAEVLPFSTGVIGEPLSLPKLKQGTDAAAAKLRRNGWPKAAKAIMTTDTRPKAASVQFASGGRTVTVTGIAKGAGMIHPDMATMLAFIACDAAIAPRTLQGMLRHACQDTFNAASVDGDTSTNDAVACAATGRLELAGARGLAACAAALREVCMDLAEQIVRDGEGASRLARVTATGFGSDAACRRVAASVAGSPLVKTMLHAGDPNVGRLLMAAGKAGVPFRPERLTVKVGGTVAFVRGARAPGYTERRGERAMKADPVEFELAGGAGGGQASMMFCDLSAEYVKINAEYRS